MKRKLWKLLRRDGFNEIHSYYLEGTRADLFALIGWIYSCDIVGTKRIDYKNVPVIDTLSLHHRVAVCDDFALSYYYKKEVPTNGKN